MAESEVLVEHCKGLVRERVVMRWSGCVSIKGGDRSRSQHARSKMSLGRESFYSRHSGPAASWSLKSAEDGACSAYRAVCAGIRDVRGEKSVAFWGEGSHATREARGVEKARRVQRSTFNRTLDTG